jgi:hypothetical protein
MISESSLDQRNRNVDITKLFTVNRNFFYPFPCLIEHIFLITFFEFVNCVGIVQRPWHRETSMWSLSISEIKWQIYISCNCVDAYTFYPMIISSMSMQLFPHSFYRDFLFKFAKWACTCAFGNGNLVTLCPKIQFLNTSFLKIYFIKKRNENFLSIHGFFFQIFLHKIHNTCPCFRNPSILLLLTSKSLKHLDLRR